MNWQTYVDPAFSGRLCLMLLHSLWQVAALALVVWGIDRLWGKRSVERSYALHVGALLVALVAMPITYFVLGGGEKFRGSHAAEAAAPVVVDSVTNEMPLPLVSGELAIEGPPSISPPAFKAPDLELPPVDTTTIWQNVTPWIVACYSLGVLLMLVRLFRAMTCTNQLSLKARKIVDGPLVDMLRSLARRWSLTVVPVLAETQEVVVPKVVGLVRPMILLPTAAVAGLSTSELEMILAHELAHVRRHDLWINLVQRLAEALLFFNPALWYLSRRISTLREYCCDEMTCQAMTDGETEPKLRYAAALLRVVELAKPSAASDLAALAASGRSPSELRRRVARLFGEQVREPVRVSRGGVLMVFALVALFACGPVIWQTNAQTDDDSTQIEQKNETTKASATNQFSFGSKVEVLALGTHGEEPQHWWDTEGNLHKDVPYSIQAGNVSEHKGNVRREIVFRIDDLPRDANVIWRVSSFNMSSSGKVVLDGKENPSGFYSGVYGIDEKIKTVNLHVGIAIGDWKTISGSQTFSSSANGLAEGKGVVFSGAFIGQSDKTVIIVSDNFKKSNKRVIAVNADGKQYTSSSTRHRSAAGTVNQTQWEFLDLAPEDIDHFEFQTREYEWVEIRGLPLQPAELTAATTDKSPPKKGKSDPQKQVAQDDAQIIGNRFVVCPVTTELQRSLLSSVSSPASDASVCVFANIDAFESLEEIDVQAAGIDELAKLLLEHSLDDNREVRFRVLGSVNKGLEFEELKKRMGALEVVLKRLAKETGFENSNVSLTYGATDDWEDFIERARLASDKTDAKETTVVSGKVKITPVTTFLSKLLTKADCVADFRPVVRDQGNVRFPDDVLPAVSGAVEKLEGDKQGRLLIRIRHTKSAKSEIVGWVEDRSNREAYARGLGFERCSFSWSTVAEEEEDKEEEEIAESELTRVTRFLQEMVSDKHSAVVHVSERVAQSQGWLRLPPTMRRISRYEMSSKKKSLEWFGKYFDRTAEFDNAWEGVLEGLERDPYGPQIDFEEFLHNSLGNQVSLGLTSSDTEEADFLLAWTVDNRKHAEEVVGKIMRNDPNAQPAMFGDIPGWVVTDRNDLRKNKQKSAACFAHGNILVSNQADLLRQVLLFQPKPNAQEGATDKTVKEGARQETNISDKATPEKLKYLTELVEYNRAIYERHLALQKVAQPGGEAATVSLAHVNLLKAQAELAHAQGNQAERAKFLEQAIAAAEQHVEAVQSTYKVGRITIDALLKAKKQLTEAKLALHEAKVKPSTPRPTAPAVQNDLNSTPEKIEYLAKQVDFHLQIWQKIKALQRVGGQGGEADKEALARTFYYKARAELEKEKARHEDSVKRYKQALVAANESVQHYEQTVKAAEDTVVAVQAVYDSGRVTLDLMLDAGKRRLDAQLALTEAKATQRRLRGMLGATAKIPVQPIIEDEKPLWERIAQRGDSELRKRSLAEVLRMLSGSSSERVTALQALSRVGDIPFDRKPLLPLVAGGLKHESAQVRQMTLIALPSVGADATLVLQLLPLAEDVSLEVRRNFAGCLIMLTKSVDDKPAGIMSALLKLLDDSEQKVVEDTVKRLWGYPLSPEVEAKLIELSREPELVGTVVYFALSTRPKFRRAVAERLVEVMDDGTVRLDTRGRAAWGLGHHQIEEDAKEVVAEALIRNLDTTLDRYLTEQSIWGLGTIGGDRAAKKLRDLAETDERNWVRDSAGKALRRLAN